MKRRILTVRESDAGGFELAYTYNDRVQAIIPLPTEVLTQARHLAVDFNRVEPDA